MQTNFFRKKRGTFISFKVESFPLKHDPLRVVKAIFTA